jgi:hypothetical protein
VSRSTRSHYGDTWREDLASHATDDCIGVDTTVIPEDAIVTFAVSGPMVDVDLPDGTVSSFLGELVPFNWRETDPARDARFGNAHSLDTVSVDVYVEIARAFGARIFNPYTDEVI